MNSLKRLAEIKSNPLLIIGMALVMVYLIFRAQFTCLTIDEASTLAIGHDQSLKSVLFYLFPTANNHWLNTILVHVISNYISMDELAIRFPNIIAGFFYMRGCYVILRRHLAHSFLKFPGFILLVAHPYLLDYFSLCRGYGISIAFMIWTIYFLIRFMMEFRLTFMLWYFLLSSLMLMSSFVTLHFYLAATLSGFIICLMKRKVNFRYLLIYTLLSVLPLALIAYPMYLLRTGEELYWGGHSLWQDTIGSLARNLKGDEFRMQWVETAIIVVPGLILLLTTVMTARKTKLRLNRPDYILTTLFCLVLLSVFLQYHLLNVLYLMNRTALFILPVFFLALIFGLDNVSQLKNAVLVKTIAYCLSGILIVGFIGRIQFNHVSDWPFNAHCKEVSNLLISEPDLNNADTLYTDHLNEYVFNYYLNYRENRGITILLYENRKDTHHAVYFLPQDQALSPGDKRLHPVREFEDIHYTLYESR